jgi:hypothetical protein
MFTRTSVREPEGSGMLFEQLMYSPFTVAIVTLQPIVTHRSTHKISVDRHTSFAVDAPGRTSVCKVFF